MKKNQSPFHAIYKAIIASLIINILTLLILFSPLKNLIFKSSFKEIILTYFVCSLFMGLACFVIGLVLQIKNLYIFCSNNDTSYDKKSLDFICFIFSLLIACSSAFICLQFAFS